MKKKSIMVETMEICPACKGTGWDETKPGTVSKCHCEDGWVKTKVSLEDIYHMINAIESRHKDAQSVAKEEDNDE